MRKLSMYYSVLFFLFLLISFSVYLLKKYVFIQNFVGATHFLVFISPLLLIVGILVPYLYSDWTIKKLQKDIHSKKKNEYLRIQKFKYWSFFVVSLIVNLNMFLLYKDQYLYMDGIILLFYLLNIPSVGRYRNDFLRRIYSKQ